MKIIPPAALLLLSLAACGQSQDPTQTPAAAPGPSAAAAAATSQTGMTDDAVIASFDGGKVTYGELKEAIGSRLIQMEVEYLTQRYQAESGAAEQLLVEKLVEAEAAKRGTTPEELMKVEVEQKTEPVTDAEVQQMYAAMQRQLRGRPLEEVRDGVAAQALQRKQAERFGAWLEELKTTAKASVNVPFPDMPRFDVSIDDDPMRGAKDAPVTIVQFAEFQCPYCGKANATVNQILEDYDGKVRMVYRDFPLSFHDRAIPAAIAANCAGEQGKYWEIHDLMMQDQRSLSDADLLAHANTLQLDVDKWQTCRQDPAQAAEVNADFEAGQALGVTGTPAFFVNGIMLSGALPYDMFAQIIDKELEKG